MNVVSFQVRGRDFKGCPVTQNSWVNVKKSQFHREQIHVGSMTALLLRSDRFRTRLTQDPLSRGSQAGEKYK